PGTATIRFGLTGSDFSTDPSNGIFFRQATSGNVFGVTRSGGTESTLDLGTKITSLSGFKAFRVVVRGGGTPVEFLVTSVSTGSLTTNIPSAALGPGFGQTFGGSAVTVDVD